MFGSYLHLLDSFVASDSEILQSENISETGQLPKIKLSASTLDELMVCINQVLGLMWFRELRFL